uniref:C2H2-type domain-containing protein n=1 Tax=Rhizophagus irregularis (strain DAOM 181602 / DAOM 197198 / MUCL 43194) TaxID=747089 RepID=U9SL69_RHIID
MSLHCPFEGCDRNFAKQQALLQHIQHQHCFVENELSSTINDHSINFLHFQEEELFKSSKIPKESENVSEIQEIFNFSLFQEIDNTQENMDNTKNVEEIINISDDDDTELTEEIMNNPSDNNGKEFMNILDNTELIEEIINDMSDSDGEEFMNISDSDIDSVDSEDFHGASFEDAVNATLNINISQWPNEIYKEFAEICINNNLSNQTTDSFIRFFNKNANIKNSPLPKNSREMHKFIDSMVAPNLDFKEKNIIIFEGVTYTLYYRSIIKTIKALLQKKDVMKDFVFQFEKKQKMNIVSN